MRIFYIFISVALAFVCGVFAHGGHNHVIVGTDENFDQVAFASKASLVKFYAPWCGHCKKLAPHYDAASNTLAHDLEDGMVSLIKVDCTEYRPLCEKYSVRGFPTLKVFRGDDQDNVIDYTGTRDEKGIVDFMLAQIKPATTELSSEEEVANFHNDGKVSVIAYMSSKDDEAFDVFVKGAERKRTDCDFGYIMGDETSKLVLTNADGDVAELWVGDNFDVDMMVEWVEVESFPVIGEIGPDNYEAYMKRGLPLLWLFTDQSDKAATQAVVDACMDSATKTKGKMSVVKLDGVKWHEHGQNFGLKDTTPGIVLVNDQEKFIFEGDCTNAEEVSQWVDNWSSGELKPFMKTEPVPENNDGDVKVIVGSTFNDIALSTKHNVMVEFYAPWCGHCKSLAPKYEEVGAHFDDREDVVVAKVDSTANDTPANIKGFPTLIFYPAGENAKPIKYDGDRTAAAIQSWIEDKSVAVADEAQGHDEL